MSNTRKATGTPSRTKKTEAPVDLDTLLGEGTRPEKVVPICLLGHLQAEWDSLKAEFDAGPGPDDQAMMHERARKRKVAERMAEVEAKMRNGTVHFRLRALPRRRTPDMPPEQVVWRELVEAHPPRKDSDGRVDPRDEKPGVNMTSFLDSLLPVSVVEPELTGQRWEQLDARLTDSQFQELALTAWLLNRGEVDVPFSRAASMMRRLDDESKRQSDSESPSNASKDGNPAPSPSTSTTATTDA